MSLATSQFTNKEVYIEREYDIKREIDILGDDTKYIISQVTENGLQDFLKQCSKANTTIGIINVIQDVTILFLATYLTTISYFFIPVTLLIFGNRIRALADLYHEAFHGSLVRNLKLNKYINDYLLGPLVLITKEKFKLHIPHHRYAGIWGIDPNMVRDHEVVESYFKYYGRYLIYKGFIFAALFGHLFWDSYKQKLLYIIWWSIPLTIIYLTLGLEYTLIFCMVYISSRLFVYHPITVFRDLCDHGGFLKDVGQKPLIRNSACTGILNWFFHPHDNGYHLLHHYFPAVSYQHIVKFHEALIKRVPYYASLQHCDSYFTGKNSVISMWKLNKSAT